MLIELNHLVNKYKLNISGILHVGAHLAEESSEYQRLGIEHVTWVEANTDLAEKLISIVPPSNTIVNAVVGENEGEVVTFHKANNGQSSSILELGTHKTAHPEVHYVSSEERTIERLDSLYRSHGLQGMNFMNLDIQGAELLAIKGLGSHLSEFDYIYTEVNKQKLYVDCCLIEDLDEFLGQNQFQRMEVAWTGFGWGDAFYKRVGK